MQKTTKIAITVIVLAGLTSVFSLTREPVKFGANDKATESNLIVN